MAAAVVAGGRASYDEVRDRGEVDLDRWQWDEAEALLVVGQDETEAHAQYGPPDYHGASVPPVSVALQWLSYPSPPRLRTTHDRGPLAIIDFGDHPDLGGLSVHDPDWVEAQSVLTADASFVERRGRVGHLGLWLNVRPAAPAGAPAPDPADHSPFDGYRAVREAVVEHVETAVGPGVVLVVPTSDFPASASRVDAYVAAVHRLLEAAEV